MKVVPTGLTLRVMAPMIDRLAEDEVREGSREFFETVQIARCSANHKPCPSALVWVYNRGGVTGDGSMECHGVVCRDLRDATRLVNTMAMGFYDMKQQQQQQPVGNAYRGAVGATTPFTPMDAPPAYRPPNRHVLEPLPLRVRLRDQPQILQIDSIQNGVNEDDAYELELTPRSPWQRSTSPRAVTPRNTARSSVGDAVVSMNTPDNCSSSPRRSSQASMRNSTVSLHSTVSASEGSAGPGHRRRSAGMPGVESEFDWGSSNV